MPLKTETELLEALDTQLSCMSLFLGKVSDYGKRSVLHGCNADRVNVEI